MKIEEKLFVEATQCIKDDETVGIYVHATYTSPAGRNNWYRDFTYTERDYHTSISPVPSQIGFSLASNEKTSSSKSKEINANRTSAVAKEKCQDEKLEGPASVKSKDKPKKLILSLDESKWAYSIQELSNRLVPGCAFISLSDKFLLTRADGDRKFRITIDRGDNEMLRLRVENNAGVISDFYKEDFGSAESLLRPISTALGVSYKAERLEEPVKTVETPLDKKEETNSNQKVEPNSLQLLITKPYFFFQDYKNISSNLASKGLNDFVLFCSSYSFHVMQGGELAVSNVYSTLSEAILLGEIIQNHLPTYTYGNPYNSQSYNRAIDCLKRGLKLFDMGHGSYETFLGLKNDYKIGSEELSSMKATLKQYLSKNDFFSISSLRKACSNEKFLSFSSSESIFFQFIESFGRKEKIHKIVVNNETNESIFYFSNLPNPWVKFFALLMNHSSVSDIYAIQDRTRDLFGVTYNLDKIGHDAEKNAGYFYSDDLEKVYFDKADFYKEIAPEEKKP